MPGSVVNSAAAALFDEFCISVVTGDDFISRLSVNTMDILKADVERLISQCDLPKYKIFGSVISNHFAPRDKAILKQETERTLPILQTRTWRNGEHPNSNPEIAMYIPGRILYIEKARNIHPLYKPPITTTKDHFIKGKLSLQKFKQAVADKISEVTHKSVDFKYVYAPRWADKNEFQEIVVSRSMLNDHVAVFGLMKEFEGFHPELPLRAVS